MYSDYRRLSGTSPGRRLRRQTCAQVVYSNEPVQLIDELIRVYEQSHYRRPSQFCSQDSACGIPERPQGETGRDVVCGMSVSLKTAAAKRIFEGKEYIFCSDSCAKQFDGDPEKYAKKFKSHV